MSRPTYTLIHGAALRHNLQRVRTLCPRSRILAAVKANAYGHGLVTVATALAPDTDGFAVACLEEALTLREAGITNRIVLLEGVFETSELAQCSRWTLDVVVHCLEQVQMLAQCAVPNQLNVWLKIETGMHRLGIAPKDVSLSWQRLRACHHIREMRVMSHLARADELDCAYTAEQLHCFKTHTNGLSSERSLAASAGILGWPDTHLEWVRPGLMLYGASPFADRTAAECGLQPAMTVMTRLIALQTRRRGDPVGYGGAWVCPEDMPVGVAAIGYGDGYSRFIPSGTPVLVNNHPAMLIGRVSMDMITIDLRDHPQARIGDPVVLWGRGLPIEVIAHKAQTIPYTLMTGMMPRVEKKLENS